MPLRGIKVLELTGLAPAPFCGKILADFGAKVTRIDRVPQNYIDVLQHGKCTLAVNLKHTKGQQLLQKLASTHDVLIEPFRPGVMERLNLGPEVLCQAHPRLIYARLTGFGQSGPLAQRAGHDMNYTAISGVLSMLTQYNGRPVPPINILADFAGGGLMCALGICLALLERHHSNRGQVVDAAMVDGAAYVASWLFMSRQLPVWQGESGDNTLDGGAFYYDTYETKDGGFMSVACLEPQFFEVFKERLQLPQLTQAVTSRKQQDKLRKAVQQVFRQKTLAEWSQIFEDSDACVFPVVDWRKTMQHAHNKERESFHVVDDLTIPKPAPRLNRTPGKIRPLKSAQQSTEEVLTDLHNLPISQSEIQQLLKERIIELPDMPSKL